jgi:hypothetical protein
MVTQLQDTVTQLQAENVMLREGCENGALARMENESLKRSIVVFKEELRHKVCVCVCFFLFCFFLFFLHCLVFLLHVVDACVLFVSMSV